VKVPKGKINDVLIQVGQFIYLIDFIVREAQLVSNPTSQTLIILGHPLLATGNTIINCWNGYMKFTFGDMTREVNVFNLEKQSRDVEDQIFEVNLIESMTSEHREQLELETESEF